MPKVPTTAGEIDAAELDAEQDFALPDWQFSYIHSALLPGLRERGVTDDQIEQMLVRNPREFFGG